MPVIEPTGKQTMSMREVDAFVTEARMAASTKSPRILWINQQDQMRAKNNGYPVWMHHPELEPREAYKEDEEQVLASLGYQRQYITREYPKALFRRNMEPKFEPRFDPATGIQVNHSFVEERTVRNAQDEKALRLMKPKNGQSAWFEKLTEIPELEDGPTEDPKVTIARLQGEIEGLKKPVKAA